MERIALTWDIISSVRPFPLFLLFWGSLHSYRYNKNYAGKENMRYLWFAVSWYQDLFWKPFMHTCMYFRIAGYFQYGLMYRFIHPDVQVNVKKPLFFLVAFTNVNLSISRTHLIPHLTDCLPWNVCLSVLITFWSVGFQEWHRQKQLTLMIEVHLIEHSYV